VNESNSREICRALTSSLLNCSHIHAAALYGSVARGDAEDYSDIDVLAVCPSSRKRDAYEEALFALRAYGDKISLSLYTPRELSFLTKQRSLFLLHLCSESLVLFDHTGLLSHLLATFKPKGSYCDDFEKSLDLLLPLREAVAGAPSQIHRLAYIYSLFRVFGVYLLANDGIYEFSKGKMSTALVEKWPHLKYQINILSGLRTLNSNFFLSGCTDVEDCSYERLQVASQALSSVLKRPVLLGQRSYHQAVSSFITSCIGERDRLGYKLRTWFLMLLYDGLNLFSELHGFPLLTGFTEENLLGLIASDAPLEIRTAASVGLDYLRNYPLRYFLFGRSKIPVSQACNALLGIERCLRADCGGRLEISEITSNSIVT
jgi:predicted nucleotidyltransferase